MSDTEQLKDHARSSDPVLALLVEKVIENSEILSEVLAKQEESFRRQNQEDADHNRLRRGVAFVQEEVQAIREELTSVPRDVHMNHHEFINELHAEMMVRKERERKRREFWEALTRKVAQEGLGKLFIFIVTLIALAFWDHIMSAYIWLSTHIGGKGSP